MGRKIQTAFRPALGILIAIFALTFLFSTGSFLEPSIAQAENPTASLTKDNPGIRTAIEAQNRHSDRLMDIPGVVGHGIGLSSEGKPVIKIFAEKAGIRGIPPVLEGVPTEVKVTGLVVAYADPTVRFRPVPIGVSTGHPDITAGTIGCRVKDASGNIYALSNNHVYANQNDAIIGDSALQPGPYDGGQDPEDLIGTLYDFEPIDFSGGDNYMDAAIVEPLQEVQLLCSTPEGDGYGTPNTTTADAYLTQSVQKYGRTTGWTYGAAVSLINTTVDVCYETKGIIFPRCVKKARFTDQIGIASNTFSAGGDSGSLIVTDDAYKKPVGLLFAGSSTYTFANPIGPILSRFNVSVDDCSGTCTPTAEVCADGVDNDCDGLVDCDDSDCASDPACSTCTPTAEDCTDGVDNDCDGLVDCDDSDCASDPACSTSCLDLGAKCFSDSDCCSGDCRGKCR